MSPHPRLVKIAAFGKQQLDWADRNWKFLTFAIWVAAFITFLFLRWQSIHWFALGDTDDNMRYLQVRDWLAGQGWYDLRQYRLNPPEGFNIHWSRIVDLPLAGLMLFFRAFMDAGQADRIACGIAPLLPLYPTMMALAFIARRIAGRYSWIAAALLPLAADMALGMYMPMRVDHHGWQLAFTTMTLAGLVDHRARRGGVVAGITSALSIAIGMEMLVYLAAGGALVALRWVFGQDGGRRMLPYALSLGGGASALFLLFASTANRAPVCDALSPVWVAILGVASAGMVVLSLAPLRGWQQRLAAGAVAGACVAAFGLYFWPQCLTGAYQISPELQRLWLVNIREAKPITQQASSMAIPLLALPLAGVLGALGACWQARRDPDRLWAWATVTLMGLFATGLLFWQVRTGPAAQLLAIPGTAWLVMAALTALFTGKPWARIAAIGVVAIGALLIFAYPLYPYVSPLWAANSAGKPSPSAVRRAERLKAIRIANAGCRTSTRLAVLDQLPPAVIFTMVDMGPRIIATTHHSAIAGPYHRNGPSILDIHHAFDGQPDGFRAIAARHHARYLLICPNFPEGTVYQARSPGGFYAQLMQGNVPGWLHRVSLKTGQTLPYTLYSIDYNAPN